MTGNLPFAGPKDKKAMEGPGFEEGQWSSVSQPFRELVEDMLRAEADQRPTLDQVATRLGQ